MPRVLPTNLRQLILLRTVVRRYTTHRFSPSHLIECSALVRCSGNLKSESGKACERLNKIHRNIPLNCRRPFKTPCYKKLMRLQSSKSTNQSEINIKCSLGFLTNSLTSSLAFARYITIQPSGISTDCFTALNLNCVVCILLQYRTRKMCQQTISKTCK